MRNDWVFLVGLVFKEVPDGKNLEDFTSPNVSVSKHEERCRRFLTEWESKTLLNYWESWDSSSDGHSAHSSVLRVHSSEAHLCLFVILHRLTCFHPWRSLQGPLRLQYSKQTRLHAPPGVRQNTSLQSTAGAKFATIALGTQLEWTVKSMNRKAINRKEILYGWSTSGRFRFPTIVKDAVTSLHTQVEDNLFHMHPLCDNSGLCAISRGLNTIDHNPLLQTKSWPSNPGDLKTYNLLRALGEKGVKFASNTRGLWCRLMEFVDYLKISVLYILGEMLG